jgi:hypothetical protein
MLGQLDARDNALAGPTAVNALRFDNVRDDLKTGALMSDADAEDLIAFRRS